MKDLILWQIYTDFLFLCVCVWGGRLIDYNLRGQDIHINLSFVASLSENKEENAETLSISCFGNN